MPWIITSPPPLSSQAKVTNAGVVGLGYTHTLRPGSPSDIFNATFSRNNSKSNHQSYLKLTPDALPMQEWISPSLRWSMGRASAPADTKSAWRSRWRRKPENGDGKGKKQNSPKCDDTQQHVNTSPLWVQHTHMHRYMLFGLNPDNLQDRQYCNCHPVLIYFYILVYLWLSTQT